MPKTFIHISYEAESTPEEGLWVNIMTQTGIAGMIRHDYLLPCPFEQAQTLAKNLNEAFHRMEFYEEFPELLQKGLGMAS